jgi:serine protease Do
MPGSLPRRRQRAARGRARREPRPQPSLFGLTLGPITDESRKTFSIGADVNGVLVTGVEPGSEADQKAVQPGDVILQVSQKDVKAPEEVSARVDELKTQGRRSVMFLVSSAQSKLRFVSLRLEPAE